MVSDAYQNWIISTNYWLEARLKQIYFCSSKQDVLRLIKHRTTFSAGYFFGPRLLFSISCALYAKASILAIVLINFLLRVVQKRRNVALFAKSKNFRAK